jgi:murein DD-endopeptidase MepM/ murein hydrolase activator NlpD
MNTTRLRLALVALLNFCIMSRAMAVSPEEVHVLGSYREQAQYQSYMPFTRAFGVSGVVASSLAGSATDAGVPPAPMLEALAALATPIDLDHDLRRGDRFYVRFEQTFTAAGNPIGIGKVLWAKVSTQAKGMLAIHRFRAHKQAAERFWLANGEAAASPQIRLPLHKIAVASGFGLRADPFDQPGWPSAIQPLGKGSRGRAPSPLTAVNVPTALALTFGLKAASTRGSGGSRGATLRMHDGVDLAAEMGTPILAAGDGIVVGAEFKGGYGNWISIEHDSASSGAGDGFRHPARLMTVYGHLSAFSEGILPGKRVRQGEVIGFVGSTGRSTGPHLHFESLHHGKPTNPMVDLALRPEQLRGGELERFKKMMIRDLQERQREAGTIGWRHSPIVCKQGSQWAIANGQEWRGEPAFDLPQMHSDF